MIKEPSASLRLLDLVAQGEVKAGAIAPGNVARLRTHPDERVAGRAEELRERLLPGLQKRAETMARLLPEVKKAGDVEKGRAMFAGACAICHRYEDLGALDVGPPLEGMGSHGVEELLGHIIDPNAEVDPSFWQWNLTLKDGQTLAGVIVSENAEGLTLRNQGGDTEIRKADIVTRVNTRRSLMPEGLEGLGAENLRDLLAFMTAGDSRYRVLDLRGSFTADGRKGLFATREGVNDRVFFKEHGNVSYEGIPFSLVDPEASANGRSLVVLRGGPAQSLAKSYPRSVEVPVGFKAARFYLVSGIAGWGYPAVKEQVVALKLTINFADGRSEVREFRNGVHFSDYIREVPVPGSLLMKGTTTRGQVRLLGVDLEEAAEVRSLTLESLNNGVVPVLAAITADLEGGEAAVQTSQASEGEHAHAGHEAHWQDEGAESTAATGMLFRKKTGEATRVLVAGAGSSHHFPRDFIAHDLKTLNDLPGVEAIGTMNLKEALARLPEADVLVFSGNHEQWGGAEFQQALHHFADAGKGLVFIHAATWSHPWEGYNRRFIGGLTTAHGRGLVETRPVPEKHPVTTGLPKLFQIKDESYHFNFFEDADITLLAENQPDGQSPLKHPALWIKKDAKARIVCYTHGHDHEAHANPHYQKVLSNAVRWVSGKAPNN
ncbi:MAG: ThuA domain-containing protein [Verrucomicrobiales bacterium]